MITWRETWTLGPFKDELTKRDLDSQTFLRLASDGASVMVGKNRGVSALLKTGWSTSTAYATDLPWPAVTPTTISNTCWQLSTSWYDCRSGWKILVSRQHTTWKCSYGSKGSTCLPRSPRGIKLVRNSNALAEHGGCLQTKLCRAFGKTRWQFFRHSVLISLMMRQPSMYSPNLKQSNWKVRTQFYCYLLTLLLFRVIVFTG